VVYKVHQGGVVDAYIEMRHWSKCRRLALNSTLISSLICVLFVVVNEISLSMTAAGDGVPSTKGGMIDHKALYNRPFQFCGISDSSIQR
jgi:hypothetical protein